MENEAKPKKRFYKRWWFWVLIAIVFIGIGSSGSQTPGTSIPAPDESSSTQVQPFTAASIPEQAPFTQTPQTKTTLAPAQSQNIGSNATETLLDISGSGSKTTESFTAAGPWNLAWSYDCSNFGGSGNFQVFVYSNDGSMSFSNSGVNQLGKSGSDTDYYHVGGSYYLEVNSECSWKIKVTG